MGGAGSGGLGAGGKEGAGEGSGSMEYDSSREQAEIAVVRSPDMACDDVLFSAKVAYQAALVEALQRSWLDGPVYASGAPRSKDASLSASRFLQCAVWEASSGGALGHEDGRGRHTEAGAGGRGRGWGRGGSVNGGVLGAAVRGLGEEIGETANGVISRAQVTGSGLEL